MIGRFLEHSRIYYFRNGADDPVDGRFFIGSADWMDRNLSDRVEAVTPVEAAAARAVVGDIGSCCGPPPGLGPVPDGSYVQRTPPPNAASPEVLGTHQTLMDLTRHLAEHERAGASPCSTGRPRHSPPDPRRPPCDDRRRGDPASRRDYLRQVWWQ